MLYSIYLYIVGSLLILCHQGFTGMIRLVGGPTEYEGRVEVFYNGIWGTVCDDGWDIYDAQVVCRQLGFGLATAAQRLAFYGLGSGQIWLDNLNCAGTEWTIGNCSHRGWGIEDCSHSEDASVNCSAVRLVNGLTKYEGRVEVHHNGVWGTVCSIGWDLNDAQVVCTEMGFGRPVSTTYNALNGQDSGQIWLDSVNCVGTEQTIKNCSHGGWVFYCDYEDASVKCTAGVLLRLVGGSSYNEGRVEVNYNGEWGTVCDDGWDDTDAGVVCRQLGFGSSGTAVGSAGFGQGSGSIWLDSVTCTGSELTLASCGHLGVGVTRSCYHYEDAGVRCLFKGIAIRLVGGSSYNEGRVEVYYNYQWGTVCDDGWGSTDAGVVCRQLGFGSSGTAIRSAGFGQGSASIWINYVTCTGKESTLSECGHLGVGITNHCYHNEDAGVKCDEGISTHYYLGFFTNNVLTGNVSIQLITSEAHQVQYYLDIPSADYILNGAISAGNETILYLPSSIEVSSHNDQDKGIYLKTSSENVTVIGQNLKIYTSDSYFALPIIELDDVYVYYGISVARGYYHSSILIVGTDNNIIMNITTTQSVDISVGSTVTNLISGIQYSFVINKFQTFYIKSSNDLSGTKIVTDKPLSVFSGHECGNVPSNVPYCSHLIEQIPPTTLWGKTYYTAPLVNKASYTIKVLAAYNSTTVNVYCNNTMKSFTINEGKSFNISLQRKEYCAIYSNKKILVAQLSHGGSGELNYGDPMITLIPATDQYLNRFDFVTIPNTISPGYDHYVNIIVMAQYYQPNMIFLIAGGVNRSLATQQWIPIQVNSITVAYAAQLSVVEGISHIVHTNAAAQMMIIVYGFNLHDGYGHSGGFRNHVERKDEIFTNAGIAVRLEGGSSYNEGRVEVYYNGEWGTVCDNSWNYYDASVVCRQLGLGSYGHSYSNAYFGQGSGPIWLDNVLCEGTESTLASCGHLGVDINVGCDHYNDAGVRCHGMQNIAIRLVGGISYYEGRVEVYYSSEWGTVCDDGWDDTDAGVVCRQLGFGSSGTAIGSAGFGQGSGSTLLDSVFCNGNEPILIRCGHLGINTTRSCSHSKDAGVICSGIQAGDEHMWMKSLYIYINIRLVGGSLYNEGRVEVNYNGEWGTVCDDGWDDTDAGVVCRQLGFGSSGTAIGSAGFGQGSGTIWLNSVTCTGTESILASCGHLGINITRNCYHYKDASVRCTGGKEPLIRLLGGRSYNEGRVEVNYNGEWGTVCDDGWDDTDAGVVCRQLGFGSSGTAIGSAGFGQGSGSIWLDSVTCTGSELILARCGHLGISIIRSCSHIEDAGVKCSKLQGIPVRLVGGRSYNEGRVEVNYNGEWGTVCDDGWDDTDAGVVCRQLGFGSSGTAIGSANFGQGSGSIWLDSVTCTGSESTLASCGHLGVGVTRSCSHFEDAGVRCSQAKHLIRLVEGSSYNEGRVEINYYGEWGTVCDDGWDDTDAGVVCRQLGLGSSGTAIGSAGFGQGSGSIWLDNVTCTGSESTLASCGHPGVNITQFCSHNADAGVRCTEGQEFKLRLVGGNSYNEGRVEVNYNGEWGTVCDDEWDDTDAGVVCRQLGFGSSGRAIGSANFGQGSGSIWLDSVTCTGNESTLASCGHVGVGVASYCDHFNDSSVICTGDYYFSVNIQQLHGLRQGRVEVLDNGQWGLVCADGWDTYDASVVCQETNLGTNGTPTLLSYNITEIIWLSGVSCIGNESQLSFCPHNGLGMVNECTFIAGVECYGGLPVIQDPPSDQTVIIVFGNETATFHCIADGEGLAYLWQRQDLELPQSASGNTTDTLVIRGITEKDGGNYKCIVSNRFGIVSSEYTTLTVTVSPPNVTIAPNNITAKVYGSVIFVCSAVGLGDFSFKWESSNLIHTNERSLTFNPVLPQQQGQYKCTVTSSYSNLSSNAFAMLHIKAPSFDSQTALLHQISSNESANTVTVFIPQADDSGGPISHYYIVISLEQLEDTEAVKDSELLPANLVKRNADLPLYVTASVHYEDLHQNFTIGDGSSSTDPISQTTFHNIPLQKQQTYYYFIRAYSAAHTMEYPFFGTSPMSSKIMISNLALKDESSSSSLPLSVIGGAITAVVVISLLVCVVIAVIVIWKKRHAQPTCSKPEREASSSVPNPIYAGNINTNKDIASPEGEEHIYDVINTCDINEKQEMESKHKKSTSHYQNLPNSVNRNADSVSIKSDDVHHDESKVYHHTPNPTNENTVYCNNPPIVKKKPAVKPVAKARRYLPTRKNLPAKEEYAVPDVKPTTENQYASLGERHKVKNQYASLHQGANYQGLVGQRSLPSQYTIPRTTN